MSADKPFARHYHTIRPHSAALASGYYADEVGKAYGFPSGSASGIVIGIVELGGQFYPTDLAAFCQARGLPITSVQVAQVQGAAITPDPGGADVEVALDVENAAAVSPAAIRVYFCANSEAGFLAAVQQAVAECDMVSVSWGAPEDQWSAAGMQALNAAMAGKPVFVASGDSGSSDGETGKHVDFPASAPNAIACGGTTLPSLSDLTKETAWADSGGGASAVFNKPPYQAGESVSGSMRGSPDVGGCADPNTPYNVYVNGAWLQVGGTSAVAPLFAGLFALVKSQLGTLPADLHPVLYAAGSCRDIVGGSNGSYQASPGYDLVTGNGIPVPSAIITALGGVVPVQPSPPPAPAPAPPPPPASGAPVSVIMGLIDGAFAQAIADAAGNKLEVLILKTVKGYVDAELPVLLSAAGLRSLDRFGTRALPLGTLVTLLQDAAQIVGVAQQILGAIQSGNAAA